MKNLVKDNLNRLSYRYNYIIKGNKRNKVVSNYSSKYNLSLDVEVIGIYPIFFE